MKTMIKTKDILSGLMLVCALCWVPLAGLHAAEPPAPPNFPALPPPPDGHAPVIAPPGLLASLPPPPALPTGTRVTTDQADYAPGATAHIRGQEYQAGETVSLQVLHADATPDSGGDHASWTVVADASGGFQTTWHVCEDDCLGSTLRLTATGLTSGRTAQMLFTDAAVAPTYQQLMSFGKPSPGAYPYGGLIQGTDGALYGTAIQGGSIGNGVVFKLNPDGTGFTILQNFDYSTTGAYPYGKLVQGADGALYGTAYYGGSSGYGTVFKLNPDGSGFSVLQHFDYSTTGARPFAGLMQGTDGALYGTTIQGGSSGVGTMFKLNPDGTGFSVLQHFDYSTTGGYSYSGLMQGMDGALYGKATSGGSSGYGTVFKLNTDGTGFTVLQNFDDSTTGGYLQGGELIQGADGTLYGTASEGGSYGHGTVFKLNPDGTGFSVLQNFDYSTTGGYLQGGALIQATDGALYGTAYLGGSSGAGTVFKLNPDGTGFTVLKHLSYGADIVECGGYLYSGVIQGTDGALYGTTLHGGSTGYGTLFKLNPDGTGFTILQHLDYSTTGAHPYGGALIQGTDGALYGTASQGGSSGYGTVFKLNPDGTGFTVLRHFDYSTTGAFLYAGLMQGMDGALYGTAQYGGSGGYGTVFKLNPDGTGFTVLQNFDDSTTGGYLQGGELIQGADGTLYGTASEGGSYGHGTVFKLNPDGTGFSVLQNFDYSTTGAYLYSGLMQGADGALYGKATSGGSSGYGTVFKLNTDGTGFTVLQNFDYSTTGGYLQGGGLVQRADGTIYGTAHQGGSSGAGTVFKLNPDGSDFSVVLNFDNSANGGYPYGTLSKGSDGNLYGTTSQGGDANAGTVFRLVFTSPNTPPVAQCQNVTVSAGADCQAGASVDDGSFDPDAGDTITTTQTPAGPYPLGDTTVTLTVTDSHGVSSTCTAKVTVIDDTSPSITCPADLVVVADPQACTALVSFAAGATDHCPVNLTYDTGGIAIASPHGFPVGVTTVHATATDSAGNRADCSFTVTVLNPNPVVTLTGPASGALYAVNTPVNFTATFTDAGGGSHTGTWLFDGIPQPATVQEPGGATPGSAVATHSFTAPGVYTVKLAVNDSCGGSGAADQIGGMDLLVVVYDPSAGFVTGGGWIHSPAGAYAPDPALAGKANFGFVSKYQKGASAPTGNTEFQFKAGGVNFSSTVYQWLVVAGAKAQYKGAGTINGAGNYGFLLTATDGQAVGGGGADRFRIKIWDKGHGDAVIYDNATGSDDIGTSNLQDIGGGSIVIHKVK